MKMTSFIFNLFQGYLKGKGELENRADKLNLSFKNHWTSKVKGWLFWQLFWSDQPLLGFQKD